MTPRNPPPHRPPGPGEDSGARLVRTLKAAWAVTIAVLLLADVTVPIGPETAAWNELIDRCLGRVQFEGPTLPLPGDMVRSRP